MSSFIRLAAGVLLCAGVSLVAQDQEAKQRIRTARDLARQGSDAIPKLTPMLSDPVPEVRVEAVKSLVEIGTQHSLDPLIRATRDNDPEVQIRATDGLVNFYLPDYVRRGLTASLRRVGTALKSRFTDVNDAVIDPYIQVRPDVIEALGKLARGSVSMDARANAARAIGILRGKEGIPDLVQAMRSSKDDQVILEGLIAMQKIRDPSAAPQITFLLRDLNEKVQIAALETTGLLRNREALPQLRDALERARNNKVRRAALTAIAMIPDEQSRPLYSRYLDDRDEGMRAAAAEGFARLKNPSDLPPLEKNFNVEQKMSPRLSLAFALVMLGKGEISEFSPLQYLIDRLNSSSWRGVSRAFLIEAAREAGVRKSLEEATKKGTRDEKIYLAQILAISGDKETIPYLEALTHDSDTDVAEQGINALKTIKARLQ